jgi:LemA protein
MDNTYFMIGGSVLFLVILWIAVGIRHMGLLRKSASGSWEFVDEKIRKRHDVVPILAEVLKAGIGEESGKGELWKLITGMVEARDQARRAIGASGDKTEKEYDFSKAVADLVRFGDVREDLSKDVGFLELKKELDDLSSDIENRSKEYNESVRTYNSKRATALYKPVGFLFRFRQKKIFEFEK